MASGQTQQGRVYAGRPNGKPICEPLYPRCTYPEDLFFDNLRLRHVASLSEVGPGRWYFDYAADKIYFADNPTGRTVEATVTPKAFSGPVDNVTIRNLIIEKYANPLQGATIRADSGTGWLIEGNQVRYNHGIGIFTGTRTTARRNHVHHNGQLGIGGIGSGALIENNQVAYTNNPQTIAYGWAAGGTKWYNTRDLVLRRNFVHHNKGPGLWTDIDNIHTLIEHNRVEDNTRNGIFHEISYDAVIRNNTVERNGFDRRWLYGAGILIAASSNVEVYGNTVSGNRNGIVGIQQERGTGAYGPYVLENLYVHGNTIIMPSGRSGVGRDVGDDAVFTGRDNRFVDNTYYLGANATPFQWFDGPQSEAAWQRYGHDVAGKFYRAP